MAATGRRSARALLWTPCSTLTPQQRRILPILLLSAISILLVSILHGSRAPTPQTTVHDEDASTRTWIDMEAYHGYKGALVLNSTNEKAVFSQYSKPASSLTEKLGSRTRFVMFTTAGPSSNGCADADTVTQMMHFSQEVHFHQIRALLFVDNSDLARVLLEHKVPGVYENGYKDGQGTDMIEDSHNTKAAVLTKYFLALRILRSGYLAIYSDWDVHLANSPANLISSQYDLLGMSDATRIPNSPAWISIVDAGSEHPVSTVRRPTERESQAQHFYQDGIKSLDRQSLFACDSSQSSTLCQSTAVWVARPTFAVIDFLTKVKEESSQKSDQEVWNSWLPGYLVGLKGSRVPIRYALLDFEEAINYPQFESFRKEVSNLLSWTTVIRVTDTPDRTRTQILSEEGWFKGALAVKVVTAEVC